MGLSKLEWSWWWDPLNIPFAIIAKRQALKCFKKPIKLLCDMFNVQNSLRKGKQWFNFLDTISPKASEHFCGTF